MYVMIDNFDSFVYNLKAYFQELGREILVRRCDEITLEELEELNPEGIILSPGPKRPWDAKLCVDTVKRFQGRIPVLGVCLGHQVIGHCAGAVVEKGVCPMHGKVTEIRNHGTGVNNLFLFHTFLPGVRTTPGLLFYSSGSSPAFSIIIKDIKICLVFSSYIYYTD